MRPLQAREALRSLDRFVADKRKDALWPLFAAHLDRGELEERQARRGERRLLADDDRHAVCLRLAFEARGDVHHVAKDRIVEPLRRADVADAAVAGVEADAK